MSCCKDKMEPVGTDSCCTPRETSQDAALMMQKTGCGCAPVVEDKESRRLVGVVTERDLCHHVAAENRRPSEVPVEKIMRAASACCGMSDSLEEARRTLDAHRATSLPVVDKEGCCHGTISSRHLREM